MQILFPGAFTLGGHVFFCTGILEEKHSDYVMTYLFVYDLPDIGSRGAKNVYSVHYCLKYGLT